MLNVTIGSYEEVEKQNKKCKSCCCNCAYYLKNVSTVTTEDGYYGLYKKDERKRIE